MIILSALLIFLSSATKAHKNYDQFSNNLLRKIITAEKEANDKIEAEDYYKSMWEMDLKPFEDGISRDQIDSAAPLGNRYLILNHTLYRKPKCVFEQRCQGIDAMLKRILPSLPDCEFIINDFDHPKINRGLLIPLFSFSKVSINMSVLGIAQAVLFKHDLTNMDILYPAWSFVKGGPALSVYPTGIGNWSGTRNHIIKYASEYPWYKKENRGFFLGSRTSGTRDALILLSRKHPELVDAKYTKNQAYKGPQDTLMAEAAQEKPLEYSCQYKYLFNYRGVAASFRFKHLFLCGSTVLHVEDGWREFFYLHLIPYYHYIPVMENTEKGLKNLLEFAKEHDEEMKNIAKRGRRWVREHLRIEDVYDYWKGLLTHYASLQQFTPLLASDVVRV